MEQIDCRNGGYYIVNLVIAHQVQIQMEDFVVAIPLHGEALFIRPHRMIDTGEFIFGVDDFGHLLRCGLLEYVVVAVVHLSDDDRDAFLDDAGFLGRDLG